MTDDLPDLAGLFTPQPWVTDAACRGMNPDVFFPARGEPTAAAKAICRECPVQTECAAYGMGEKFGIWGGNSERERRTLRGQLPRGPRRLKPIEHGTPGGYDTHRRRGEEPCPDCKHAKAQHAAWMKRREVA